jgi:hypothetical protein
MERRELFKILGATSLAPTALSAPYQPKFFSASEASAAERLADIILPADGNSPGAAEAGVIRYMDLVLHYGNAELKQRWKKGLAAVDADAQRRFSKRFLECDRASQEQVLAAMAENEGRRQDELGRFFEALKRLSVEAYHFSPANWQKNVRYAGHKPISEFPGCRHPNHRGEAAG